MSDIIINRVWAMPNKNTFSIKPIKELINRWLPDSGVILDPFANNNKLATITNDIDTQYDTDYHLDAIIFIKSFESDSIDAILYDPPYSPRQVSESYKKMGMSVNLQTTQSSFWGNLKKEIARIVMPDGIVISFAWNSNGIGKTKGFKIEEILLVAHGGNHNDTICVVEKKIK